MKNKGFTLIELLAVIAILAIILLIAIPAIFNTIDDARKGSIESSAKLVAKYLHTKALANQVTGGTYLVSSGTSCPTELGLAGSDYTSCTYGVTEIGDVLDIKVTVIGAGKLAKWKVVDATSTGAEAIVNN